MARAGPGSPLQAPGRTPGGGGGHSERGLGCLPPPRPPAPLPPASRPPSLLPPGRAPAFPDCVSYRQATTGRSSCREVTAPSLFLTASPHAYASAPRTQVHPRLTPARPEPSPGLPTSPLRMGPRGRWPHQLPSLDSPELARRCSVNTRCTCDGLPRPSHHDTTGMACNLTFILKVLEAASPRPGPLHAVPGEPPFPCAHKGPSLAGPRRGGGWGHPSHRGPHPHALTHPNHHPEARASAANPGAQRSVGRMRARSSPPECEGLSCPLPHSAVGSTPTLACLGRRACRRDPLGRGVCSLSGPGPPAGCGYAPEPRSADSECFAPFRHRALFHRG